MIIKIFILAGSILIGANDEHHIALFPLEANQFNAFDLTDWVKSYNQLKEAHPEDRVKLIATLRQMEEEVIMFDEPSDEEVKKQEENAATNLT